MHCVSLDGILLFVLTHTSHSTAPYASIGRSRSLGSRTRRDEENITLRYANQFHSICIRSVTSRNHDASHGLHGSKSKSKEGQSLASFARSNSLVTENAKSVILRSSSLSLAVSRMMMRVLDMDMQDQKQKQTQKQRNEQRKPFARRSSTFFAPSRSHQKLHNL
jgi:hypothetical protein